MHFSFPTPGRTLPTVDDLLVIAPKACFGPRARGAGALTKLLGKELPDSPRNSGTRRRPGCSAARRRRAPRQASA